MADIKLAYGTSGQTITITLASLANGGYRESTYVDNSSNKFLDALVGGKITTGSTPTGNTNILVFAYGTNDGGTIYSGGATGSDAGFTWEGNLMLVGAINTDSAGTGNKTYEFGPWSIAQAFGGILPERWGVVVKNETGFTLHGTGSNHAVKYQGIYQTAT